MQNNNFDILSQTLEQFVKDLGSNYNVVRLEGNRDGNPIECFIIEVNGQNYIQIDSFSFIAFFNLFPSTKYQSPVYHCFPNKTGKYILTREGETIINYNEFSVNKLIEKTFGNINQQLENRDKVVNVLNEYMDGYVLPGQIGYDVNDQTFHFLDWNKKEGNEYLFFSNYFRSLRDWNIHLYNRDDHYIAKYTSLDTALMILNSKKMRMMSVTAMNDKMEIGHLYANLTNKESAYLNNKTLLNIARKRYITSFTTKIDDLTMWRLYGNNGNGVCLLFQEPFDDNYFFPVDYLGKKSTIVEKAKKICEEIKKQGYNFTFKSLETVWQYFLKPSGFKDEKELRYLRIENSDPDGYSLASNGIISGYKDFFLVEDEHQKEEVFPASLVGIILGPNMSNAEINRFQLEALAHEKCKFLLEGVVKSSIDYYI